MTSKKSVRPDDRVSVLRLRQSLKMARSAHAYVRGSTSKFYEWLDHQKRGTLPEGPAVWICGDCHVGNLGPVAGVEGRVAIEIRGSGPDGHWESGARHYPPGVILGDRFAGL